MENKTTIVAAQFGKKVDGEREFGGREYTYFTTCELKVGDVVKVPGKYGENTVRISRVDVPDSEISGEVRPHMKTITEIKRPEEPKSTADRKCTGDCNWCIPHHGSDCQEGKVSTEQ
jgi:hypothetical protein